MPSLLDLLNNLPNFPYYYGGTGNFTGNKPAPAIDQPGGGISGEPFIYKQPSSTSNFDDGLIRGGIVLATERSLDDVKRIAKFFAKAPEGPRFLNKQVGLQLSAPKLENRVNSSTIPGGGTLLDRLSALPSQIENAVGATRIYNFGFNTLTQVGAEAFGGHFYRHGLLPTMDENDKYFSIVRDNNKVRTDQVTGSSGNRLLRLAGNLQDSFNNVVDTYIGGPGSVYGIGRTTINRVVDTLGDATPLTTINGDLVPLTYADITRIGQDGILVVKTPQTSNPQNPTIHDVTAGSTTLDNSQTFSFDMSNGTTDFRLVKNALYNTNLPATDYSKFNIETRIGRGNPGRAGLDRSKYSTPLIITQDKINMLSLFYAKDPPQSTSDVYDLNSGQLVTPESVRDIVKFRIEAIDNDNPAYSVWMVFRAFITNFNDSFTGDWNEYKYTGRGERFYVYDGFTREISIGFMIVAQSRQEMKPLYQKLNYLMSNIAPDYNTNNKMRGPVVKLTLGDYMYRQPGILTSLDIHVNQDYPWEIAMDEPDGTPAQEPQDDTMHEVPMILSVNLSFKPLHSFLPKKGASVPFISVTDRRSPSNTSTVPLKNNWLADDGKGANNTDGSPQFVRLDDKIKLARNVELGDSSNPSNIPNTTSK